MLEIGSWSIGAMELLPLLLELVIVALVVVLLVKVTKHIGNHFQKVEADLDKIVALLEHTQGSDN